MSAFEFAGLFFMIMGAVQSLLVTGFLCVKRGRGSAAWYLFLFMGILFILTGVWMYRLN